MAFERVGYILAYEIAVAVDAPAQACTVLAPRRKHHHSGALEVVAIEDIVGVAVFAVGFLHDSRLKRVDISIEVACLVAHFGGFVEPCLAFVGVLFGNAFELAVYGGIAVVEV